MKVLLGHAAAIEGSLIAEELPGATTTLGVGKVEATLSIARLLAGVNASERPDALLLFGVCGAHRRAGTVEASPSLEVGDLCLVGEDELADEGVATESGFLSLAELGLAQLGPFCADLELTTRLAEALALPVVVGSTVSTCSGTDARARELEERRAAAIETMEGAAVARVCGAFSIPFVQLRGVSNFTGERERAAWDLARASEAVQRAILRLLSAGIIEPWRRDVHGH